MSETPNTPWFQFSLRDMLLGTALVAIGVGGLVGIVKANLPMQLLGLTYGVLYGSGALIGVGLFSPFRQKTLGAVLGFLLVYPALILLDHLLTTYPEIL